MANKEFKNKKPNAKPARQQKSTATRRYRPKVKAADVTSPDVSTEIVAGISSSNVGTSQAGKFFPSHRVINSYTNAGTSSPGVYNGALDWCGPEVPMVDKTVRVVPKPYAMAVPSAARIDVALCFGSTGVSGGLDSGIELASKKLYEFICLKRGNQQQFNPNDLAVYLMAITGVFNLTAELKRDIRLVQTQRATYPYFVPGQMFNLLRLRAPEVTSEAAELNREGGMARYGAKHVVGWINELNAILSKFNSLPIPAEIPLFEYNDDLFSAIFADTMDTLNAQLYIYASRGSWIYEEDAVESKVGVVFDYWPTDVNRLCDWKTIDEMLDRLDEMVERLINCSTSSTMMLQYLRESYGTDHLRQISLLEPTAFQPPIDIIYDEEMLMTIENARIVSHCEMCSYYADAMSADAILGAPFCVNDAQSTEPRFLTVAAPLQFHVPHANITPERIGKAMRFHPLFSTFGEQTIYTRQYPDGLQCQVITPARYYGFGLVTGVMTVTLERDNWKVWTTKFCTSVIDVGSLLPSAVANYMANAADFAHFPVLPIVKMAADSTTSCEIEYYGTTAARDIELVLSRRDVEQLFIGITESAWCSMLTRDIKSRTFPN